MAHRNCPAWPGVSRRSIWASASVKPNRWRTTCCCRSRCSSSSRSWQWCWGRSSCSCSRCCRAGMKAEGLGMRMVVLALAVLYATICAVFDARTFRVPNVLTLPALALALAYRVVVSTTLGESILSALVGVLFLYAAWFNGFFRGADAKVMMALWLLFPDVTLCVTVCVAMVLYWLIRRAFSKAQ